MNFRNYLFICLSILWAFVIFLITASPTATGSNTHDIIQTWLGIDGRMADILNFIIRKLAHVTVFGLLAIFLYFAFTKNRFLWAWLCITLYAGTDEYHQSLVGGRTPSVYDVMIDFAGAIVALVLIRFVVRKIREKRMKVS
ncbi:VanZ family protein [Rummeliibacillus sp. JY-2-4R]